MELDPAVVRDFDKLAYQERIHRDSVGGVRSRPSRMAAFNAERRVARMRCSVEATTYAYTGSR